MIFIGDVHGKYNQWRKLTKRLTEEGKHSLQVGDFGLFRGGNLHKLGKRDPKMHRFIRGNHDNPSVCKRASHYLGDFGYDEHTGIFYAGGGYSIDHMHRTIGRDWWPDEELTYAQAMAALALYQEVKPRIVVTHEIHSDAKPWVANSALKIDYVSCNEAVFQQMWEWEGWKPEYWIFGHYHQKKEFQVKGHRTVHVCLDEMMRGRPEDIIFEIPGLEWKLPEKKEKDGDQVPPSNAE